jgi:hypothetical protein
MMAFGGSGAARSVVEWKTWDRMSFRVSQEVSGKISNRIPMDTGMRGNSLSLRSRGQTNANPLHTEDNLNMHALALSQCQP